MFTITIDGLAGCGKSTIAKELSKALRFARLNTGAIYRALTCEYLLRYGTTTPSNLLVEELVKNLDVKVNVRAGEQRVIVNSHDHTKQLRDEVVSNLTPIVSGYEVLRAKVRSIQRDFAKKHNSIVEGRDIGSVVLPNADLKLFFVASSDVRAQRRFLQLEGAEDRPPLDELKREIEKRDEVDATREHGTMKPADDAVVIDNSNQTVEQTLETVLAIVKQKMAEKSKK